MFLEHKSHQKLQSELFGGLLLEGRATRSRLLKAVSRRQEASMRPPVASGESTILNQERMGQSSQMLERAWDQNVSG